MSDQDEAAARLRPAIVLSTTEDACTVFAAGQRAVIPYADPFPKPRAKRVAPGHLVAVATVAEGSVADVAAVVVWRWFDAVVLERAGRSVSLWEPGHGVVLAEPRDLQRTYWPGSRPGSSSPGLAYGPASPERPVELRGGRQIAVSQAVGLDPNHVGLSLVSQDVPGGR
jgi:hypothetical protein